MNHQFELPSNYKKWTWGLLGAGAIAVIYGLIFMHPFDGVAHEEVNEMGKVIGHKTVPSEVHRFWAVLLQNPP